MRNAAGERDGWICHRCGLPIDRTVSWPHPLAAVADHYPVSRADGGPPILANIKVAHSLCNGSSYLWARGAYPDVPIVIPEHRRPADEMPTFGERRIVVTPDHQRMIDAIVEVAGGGGFPLLPSHAGSGVEDGRLAP